MDEILSEGQGQKSGVEDKGLTAAPVKMSEGKIKEIMRIRKYKMCRKAMDSEQHEISRVRNSKCGFLTV